MDGAGKKTAAALYPEVAREISTLLVRIFGEQRKTDQVDLEATEMALRSALHQAGAAALTEPLRTARLEVTAKSVERHAEAIGADSAAKQPAAIPRARSLDLPVIPGDSLPISTATRRTRAKPSSVGSHRSTAGRRGCSGTGFM